MAKRTQYIIRETAVETTPPSMNLLIGFIAGIMFGGLSGYVLGTQSGTARPIAPVVQAAAASPAPAPHVVNEQELQTYRNILAADPKNAKAAEALGNKLYDAHRYAEAIPYYRQALRVDPRNINVSTDLGTALFESGQVDDALAQFERSLGINPKHAQTLFNIGIVKLNGKQDAAGAIASWERLLADNPGYPEKQKVQQLIADARSK